MAGYNIFITGAAGFIGSHAVKHSLAQGHSVWGVDNLLTGQMTNIENSLHNPKFRFDQADLTSWKDLQEAVSWADRIFHFAATVGQRLVLSTPVNTMENNIHCCEAIMHAMDSTKSKARFILASTSELYRNSEANADGTFSETASLKFPSGGILQETYPVSKLADELMVLSYTFQKGIFGTIARIFNTIGINQSPAYGMVVPSFLKQALAGEPITIYGDGLQSRSFCNVADTVKALDLLLESSESKGKIVNVGNNLEHSILDLAKTILRITKSKSEIRFISYREAYGVEFKDVRRRCPDLQLLQQMTGFIPTIPLEQTLQEIIQEMKI